MRDSWMKVKVVTLCLPLVLAGCRAAPALSGTPPAAAISPAATRASVALASRVPLVVFAAGSLIIPFDALEAAFEERYPQIDLRPEYHGSIQVIRHATELHDEIDVVASADATLIPMLMYAAEDPETGRPYADWYIRFASNRVALAYTANSQYADEINADNWFEVLTRPGVRLGLSDPRFDALGYRALMVFALAQEEYERPDLFQSAFGGRLSRAITLFWDDDLATVTVPEILETVPQSGLVLRGSSIQLIALLESGDVDYAFEYESVIRQHGLEMLPLPDALNLGVEGMDEAYARVQVNLDFRRFATVKPQFRGERIGYGITIPSSARHPEEAVLFIAFLLGPEGRALMEAYHHPLFNPAIGDHYDAMPPDLQTLCVPAETQ
jgi:molybdate/tungstate transport system substrate-binding protein